MPFIYRPELSRAGTAAKPSPGIKPLLKQWPGYGEWCEIDGKEWIVEMVSEPMNLVQIATPHAGAGERRFFTIADWKRLWVRAVE